MALGILIMIVFVVGLLYRVSPAYTIAPDPPRQVVGDPAHKRRLLNQFLALAPAQIKPLDGLHHAAYTHDITHIELWIRECDWRHARLELNITLHKDTLLYDPAGGTLDHARWNQTHLPHVLDAQDTKLAHISMHKNVLTCTIETASDVPRILAIFEEIHHELSRTTSAWHEEHIERVTREDEPAHSATSSITHLLATRPEQHLNMLPRYNATAFVRALRHVSADAASSGWLDDATRGRLTQLFIAPGLSHGHRLVLLDVMDAYPDDVFWHDGAIVHTIEELVCQHPEHDAAFRAARRVLDTPRARVRMVLARLSHVANVHDTRPVMSELLSIDFSRHEQADLLDALRSEAGAHDAFFTLLMYGMIDPGGEEFAARSCTGLPQIDEETPDGFLVMWCELVRHHRDVLRAHVFFMEVLISQAMRPSHFRGVMQELFYEQFVDSPHALTHIQALLPATAPHTPKGWGGFARAFVARFPAQETGAYMLMLDLVYHCPDEAQREALIDRLDDGDPRHMAFRLVHKSTPEHTRLYLIQKLTQLEEEPLPSHVCDALCHVLLNENRPSIYSAPLTRLSEQDDVRLFHKLAEIVEQLRFSRAKRDAIIEVIARMRERMNARGGELTLSEHDERKGAVTSSSP